MHVRRTMTDIMKDANDFDHIKIDYPDMGATFYTQGFEFNKFRGDDHFEELEKLIKRRKLIKITPNIMILVHQYLILD